jgi:hypothetical protein
MDGTGVAAAPQAAPEAPVRADAPARTAVRVVAGAIALAFAALVIGGYGLGWHWTGFADNGTLWSWLDLLVLPVAFAVVPLWLKTRRRLSAEWRALVVLVAAIALILLYGGYEAGWTWTGFHGRTLWDWLELTVLPLTVLLAPARLASERAIRREERLLALLAAVVFVVLVVGGYGLGWSWTGFEGNTLWDWLHLLLVPFILPLGLVVVKHRLAAAPAAGTAAGAQ